MAIQCMMAHSTNRHVGRDGALFLANICTKATQSTLCKAGAPKVLNERLAVNADCGEVCGAAIMGLYKLCEGGIYFICEKIVEVSKKLRGRSPARSEATKMCRSHFSH